MPWSISSPFSIRPRHRTTTSWRGSGNISPGSLIVVIVPRRILDFGAPEAAEIVGDLEAEHERIGTLARHFREAIQNVLDEVEVSRDAFDTVARHFIRDQRRHLQMEEERFFPLAVEKLTPGDWAEIDARITDEDDPVFGSDAAAEFAALRNDLLQWEEEDEAEESD